MQLKDWCQKAHVYSTTPNFDYTVEYAKDAAQISNAISEFHGVKTDLHSDLSEKAHSDLKVSLILSDFISLFSSSAGTGAQLAVADGKSSSYFPKSAALPQDFLEKLHQHEGNPVIKPGYLFRTDHRMQQFLREVESLTQSGRLMIRPTPIVMGLEREPTPEGHQNWNTVFVEPNSPSDLWFAQTEGIQNAIPLKQAVSNSELEVKLCSFAVPYLEGLAFDKLAEILDHEEDSLAGFRKSVRDMLTEIRKDPVKANDILNDVIRPATDTIERKFKSITNIHRLKVAGASLGVVTLGLTALTTAGVGAALAGLLGASGLGLITKEYADHLKEKAQLKEMPHYLLWRLGREGRK